MQLFPKKRTIRIIVSAVLFFLFCCGGKISAAPLSLTLEDVIEKAVAESITLQKSAIDLGMAQFRAEHLWSEMFPGITLRAGLTILPDTALFTDPHFSYNSSGASYSVSLGLSLQFNAGIPYSMKLTRLAYQRGLLDYENARRRVVLDITKIFYTLLANQKNIENLKRTLELAELNLEKNRVARANGLIGELPWLQNRLSVETARYNLGNAQGAYENSLKDFLTTIGMDRDTEVILAGTIEPFPFNPDPEALIFEYLPKRPDIMSQRQTIERLELSRTQTNLSLKVPSISLSTTWSGGPARNSGIGGRFSDNLSASLSVSIPVDAWIPGTKSNQSIRAADAEIEKARLDLVNTESTAKAQIRSLSESLKNSWRSIEIARLRVEIAERTYELTDAGFHNGVVEYLGLENTRNDLEDARYRLLQSELTYLNLLLDLASALNIDLETLTRSGL